MCKSSLAYIQSAVCMYKKRLLCTRKKNKCQFLGRFIYFAAFPAFAKNLASNRVHTTTGNHRWKAKQTNKHTASTNRLAESVLSGAITAGVLYCSRLLKYPRNNDRGAVREARTTFELSPHLVSLLQLKKSLPTVKAVDIIHEFTQNIPWLFSLYGNITARHRRWIRLGPIKKSVQFHYLLWR